MKEKKKHVLLFMLVFFRGEVLRAMCLSLALSPHSLLSGGDCSFVGCRHYGHASSAVPPIHYCAAGFKNPIHKKRGRSPPDLI